MAYRHHPNLVEKYTANELLHHHSICTDNSRQDDHMSWRLQKEDVKCLAEGAAFLGTGGGGDPYIGRLIVEQAIEEYGSPEILHPSEISDELQVCSIAGFGAPTVQMEKLIHGDEVLFALRKLEEVTGKTVGALIPAEIGGGNSMTPIMVAAKRQLPVIDADGMGRAFPELQMNHFSAKGIRATPLVVVDEHLNYAVIEASSDKVAEGMTRALAIKLGLRVFIAGFSMTGRQVKQSAIGGTLSVALEIGRTLRQARSTSAQVDPVNALLNCLRSTELYHHAEVAFDGKIVDLRRDTAVGFSAGECKIDALDGSCAEVTFQNENLRIRVDGLLRGIVPDLICIVDRETGAPIPTQSLRYGQRIKVLTMSAPSQLRDPSVRHFFGPAEFGLPEAFIPVETLAASP